MFWRTLNCDLKKSVLHKKGDRISIENSMWPLSNPPSIIFSFSSLFSRIDRTQKYAKKGIMCRHFFSLLVSLHCLMHEELVCVHVCCLFLVLGFFSRIQLVIAKLQCTKREMNKKWGGEYLRMKITTTTEKLNNFTDFDLSISVACSYLMYNENEVGSGHCCRFLSLFFCLSH